MIYKPENVELAITHDDIEQEVSSFDESTYVENLPPKKKKYVKSSKSSRCKDTIDWVEEEYGDSYKKPKKGSTLVKHLTKSEIESLRQNKRDAYALMIKMD